MGQINKEFAELMLERAERGDHSGLTVWEEKQLALAWLALHGHKTWPGMPCKCHPPEVSTTFAAGAAAQREADLALFAKWAQDVELPFGGSLKGRHTFNVDYPDYVRGEPLVKP